MRQIHTFSAKGAHQSPALDYAQSPLRQVTGNCLRPGGPALTARGLDLCAFTPGSLVLDLGCGPGASLSLLRERGCRGLGLDISRPLLAEAAQSGAPCLLADMAAPPLAPACLDGVVCECALSLARDKAAVLAGCARSLKAGGILLLSDLVALEPDEVDRTGGTVSGKACERDRSGARGKADAASVADGPGATGGPDATGGIAGSKRPAPGKGFACAAGAVSQAALLRLVAEAGLRVLAHERHDACLRELAARLVWHFGSLAAFFELWHSNNSPEPPACGRNGLRLGYILVIAQKTEAA